VRLQVQETFFLRQRDDLVQLCFRDSEISAKDFGKARPAKRIHQSTALTDLSRLPDRLSSIRKCGNGKPERPQGQRSIRQDSGAGVLAKLRPQRAMLVGPVKSDRAIKTRPAFRDPPSSCE
jgi:hypothetical protein